jgi:hypothetical protein
MTRGIVRIVLLVLLFEIVLSVVELLLLIIIIVIELVVAGDIVRIGLMFAVGERVVGLIVQRILFVPV